MRMWGVDPRLMCQQHLMGEHVEMHMFVGTINRGTSIQGYIDGGLVEVHMITERHRALAADMLRRGIRHKSPLLGYKMQIVGKVNADASLRELARRCRNCRALQRTKRDKPASESLV